MRDRPRALRTEKFKHIEDAGLLPDDTVQVRYDVPADLPAQESPLADLPENWRADERLTRSLPSVIVPIPDADDSNLIINHRLDDSVRITISGVEKFAYDPRLFVFWLRREWTVA